MVITAQLGAIERTFNLFQIPLLFTIKERRVLTRQLHLPQFL